MLGTSPVVYVQVMSESTNEILQKLLGEFSYVFPTSWAVQRAACESPFERSGNLAILTCKACTVLYVPKQIYLDEVDWLVAEGVLSLVATSEWATPVVLVVSRNGHITLNAMTKTKQHLLLRVEDVFTSLSGGEVLARSIFRMHTISCSWTKISRTSL